MKLFLEIIGSGCRVVFSVCDGNACCDFFMLFSVFAPVILVFGIIRFIALEKPSRYAKITNWISNFFVKEKSKMRDYDLRRAEKQKF